MPVAFWLRMRNRLFGLGPGRSSRSCFETGAADDFFAVWWIGEAPTHKHGKRFNDTE